MTLNVTKAGGYIPVSQETLDDAIDMYVAMGWPNRCVLLRACFIHTRFNWFCGEQPVVAS